MKLLRGNSNLHTTIHVLDSKKGKSMEFSNMGGGLLEIEVVGQLAAMQGYCGPIFFLCMGGFLAGYRGFNVYPSNVHVWPFLVNGGRTKVGQSQRGRKRDLNILSRYLRKYVHYACQITSPCRASQTMQVLVKDSP